MEVQQFTESADVLNIIDDLKDKLKDKTFSDVIDDEGNQYVDLVMEGGGVLGIALVGYTYIMEQVGIRFLRVGGTSAGSINALLVASLGTMDQPKSEKVVSLLANLNMYEFIDGDTDAKEFVKALVQNTRKFKLWLAGVQVLDNLEEALGLNPGDAFFKWLSGVLRKERITTTRHLQQRMSKTPVGLRHRDEKELTPEQKTGYLALVTADISTETKVEFPRMASLYWNEPETVNPAVYVRASMSIPFFFSPLRVGNIPKGKAAREKWKTLAHYTEDLPEECVFIDGGIMSNFPIDLFHKSHRVPTVPTFGVKLGTDKRLTRSIEKPAHLAGAVFNSARHCLDYDFIARNPDYKQLVKCIDTGNHNWLDFKTKNDDKVDLFIRGARAAAEFLKDFDWKQYKEIRRQLAKAYDAAE